MILFKNSKIKGIKDIDEAKGTIIAYASAFDILDSDGDIITNTAFNKSISYNEKKQRILHLLQHNPSNPLGKPSKLWIDEKGLLFQSEIVKTTYGSDTIKLYAAGVYNEHSIGYALIPDKMHREEIDGVSVNVIRELKLYEVSTVSWGANEFTPMVDLKSEYDILDRIQKALLVKGLTDEAYRYFETKLVEILNDIKNFEPDTQKAEPVTQQPIVIRLSDYISKDFFTKSN